jgi:hypothetical protein
VIVPEPSSENGDSFIGGVAGDEVLMGVTTDKFGVRVAVGNTSIVGDPLISREEDGAEVNSDESGGLTGDISIGMDTDMGLLTMGVRICSDGLAIGLVVGLYQGESKDSVFGTLLGWLLLAVGDSGNTSIVGEPLISREADGAEVHSDELGGLTGDISIGMDTDMGLLTIGVRICSDGLAIGLLLGLYQGELEGSVFGTLFCWLGLGDSVGDLVP